MTTDGKAPNGGKYLVMLPNEEFCFDPYQVVSIQTVEQDPQGRQKAKTRIKFMDGSWSMLTTGFDEVVEELCKVATAAGDL